VYQYLYDHGAELFADAKKIGDLKTIHATVVGYGKHGEEFVKALLWYCQLPGYKIDLTVIDSDKNAQSRFRAKLTGLVTDQDFDDPGDVRYRISFKTLTVGTKEFADEVKRGGEEKRHFFLCLGDDTLNTNAYRMIKQERERIHARTSITAVIRNAVTKKLINGENIRVIGDFKDYYSMKIFTSDNSLIGLGYEEHKRWTENAWSIFEDKSDKKKRKSKKPWLRYAQNTYYFNDYNFYSSISKAIHRGLHAKGADLGVDKKYQAILENTKDIGSAIDYCALVSDKLERYDKGILEDREAFECELQAIAELEHVRWNAYMLTEGWIAGPIKDKKCKVHDLLVSVEKLPYDEILKDI
jgi:hypothetical protein